MYSVPLGPTEKLGDPNAFPSLFSVIPEVLVSVFPVLAFGPVKSTRVDTTFVYQDPV